MQETNAPAKLPGYITHEDPLGFRSSTLIRKSITAIQHKLQQSEQTGILTELIPQKTGRGKSMYILNIYCKPKKKQAQIRNIVKQPVATAGSCPLVIVGDFNAAHPIWGYRYSNKRGNELAAIIEEEDLTLLTDSTWPTRVGNSVTTDTCPDLSLTRITPQAVWTNTEENLGSDHLILVPTVLGV